MIDGLCAEHIVVSYGNCPVIRDVSVRVAKGAILAIVGRSGSGKSTALRAMCALQEADEGTVTLGGQRIIEHGKALFSKAEIRRHIMMVSQGPSLLPHLKARRNIELGLERVRGLSRGEATERTERLAEELGLSDVLNLYPEQLSGGQMQRVAIARVVALQPEVLLLDEVTSALDPQTIKDVVSCLYRLRRLESGADQTIIIVTHLLSFAFDFADYVAFLHNGVIFECGPADTFARDVEKSETRAFLSTLEALDISGA